ncbi:hypothetical protein BH10ACI4_BH10ACI4_03650 [soil metagenome]
MSNNTVAQTFSPNPPQAGVLSWIHIGDLHMLDAGEPNDLDLQAIVERINTIFARSISFVFLPGDVAERGAPAAYAIVRAALARLQAPWCSILGDHDVHEKTFAPYLEAMAASLYYAFSVGAAVKTATAGTADSTRFIAMSAFDVPHPGSFTVSQEQLDWLKYQLEEADTQQQRKVILLHCYPSDLKVGGKELSALIRQYRVQLVDMGHTHYNEIANDGHTLYTATRSTGQIEEGAVGFSITNIDDGNVSWRFVELDQLDRQPTVMITAPSDHRLITPETPRPYGRPLTIRAKVWNSIAITKAYATLAGKEIPLQNMPDSDLWQGICEMTDVPQGLQALRVVAEDAQGRSGDDTIYIDRGETLPEPQRALRDQDNFIAAWPEHGLLATQLGPNKNGRKW